MTKAAFANVSGSRSCGAVDAGRQLCQTPSLPKMASRPEGPPGVDRAAKRAAEASASVTPGAIRTIKV